MERMSEREVVQNLRELIADNEALSAMSGDEITKHTVKSADTFEEAGVMTTNQGLVLRFWNGQVFQLTIVEATR